MAGVSGPERSNRSKTCEAYCTFLIEINMIAGNVSRVTPEATLLGNSHVHNV